VDESDAIIMPRNSALGIVIGGCAFTASFAIIWHIWWLLFVALLALLAVVLARTFAEDTEHVISL
jgi:cytochrome o ubiquinol oxidase subunit 1